MASWDQEQRDLAGETLFRFMSHSLYGLHAFNGDPHPGNYMFHGDGKVTFLDFGLVKHFTDREMATFVAMVKAAAYDRAMAQFRRVVEDAGMLQRDAPVSDEVVGDYFSQFYANVRTDAVVTWSSDYANGIVHHIFDRSSPIAQYATVPKQFVFIQRINLGLYALLGELNATGNYRRMAEELWPFVQGPPSTPLGIAEQPWLERLRSRAPATGGDASVITPRR
jgi:predicted unusual protein kinase regulating ubiquinone biosynthesis (AarF/ABC1/UbiB family)